MKSRIGSSMVLGSIMLVIVSLIVGLLFYSYVSGSLEIMTRNYNTQMQRLLLEGATINSTHITAMLKNAGPKAVRITNAYVNNIPALLQQNLQIAPSSIEAAHINGAYQKGTTYQVKLAGIFGILLKFEVSF
ncbi:MAG: hypothetical protein ACE5KC_01605 [Candidatus Bathyarchaeia archaeon]